MPQLPISTASEKQRIAHLDGLRGLTALFVVLANCVFGFLVPVGSATAPGLERLSHFAVPVFLVISGYCLSLTNSDVPKHRGATLSFLKRRAYRILPPYYAALAVSLLITNTTTAFDDLMAHTVWQQVTPISPASLLSHLLLFHNLSPTWLFRISSPLWSMAVQWQCYLVFWFLLRPMRARFGAPAALLVTVPALLLPWFVPTLAHSVGVWYFPIFALGMAAADDVTTSQLDRFTHLRESKHLRRIQVALWSLGVAVALLAYKAGLQLHMLADLTIGAATAISLVACSMSPRSRTDSRRRLSDILTAKPCVSLGRISYGLYLTHMPILALVYLGIARLNIPLVPRIAIMAVGGLPLTLAVAWLFFVAVERHFQRPAPRWLGIASRRILIGGAAITLAGLVIEYVRHRKDWLRYNAGQTYVNVQETPIRYRRVDGPPHSPLIVFVSALEPLEEWNSLQLRLRDTASTLAYDRCGFGFYGSAQFHCNPMESAVQLNNLLDKLAITHRIYLLGYSASGAVLEQFARLHPERLAGLIFLDPTIPDKVDSLHDTLFGIFAGAKDSFKAALGYYRFRKHPSYVIDDKDALDRWYFLCSQPSFWIASARLYQDAIHPPHSVPVVETFGDTPTAVLSTRDPSSSEYASLDPELRHAHAKLAKKSSHSVIQYAHNLSHGELVGNPKYNEVTAEFIKRFLDSQSQALGVKD
jgi:peptidoglycan/LPS O-acetylase OafA/YrhL/pimeloyl-ACP methyl ester carboxylesterase